MPERTGCSAHFLLIMRLSKVIATSVGIHVIVNMVTLLSNLVTRSHDPLSSPCSSPSTGIAKMPGLAARIQHPLEGKCRGLNILV